MISLKFRRSFLRVRTSQYVNKKIKFSCYCVSKNENLKNEGVRDECSFFFFFNLQNLNLFVALVIRAGIVRLPSFHPTFVLTEQLPAIILNEIELIKIFMLKNMK